VVQKLFFVVVFRVKGADDVGLAVEDANNITIVIVVSEKERKVSSVVERGLSLFLFSLSLSLLSKKVCFCGFKKTCFQKTTPLREKKRQCKTLKFFENS